MNRSTAEYQPLAGSELEPAAASHLPLPEWLKRPGRLALSTLAIAGGSTAVELAVDPLEAHANYVERIQPVKAQPRHAKRHDDWIELDSSPYGYYLGEFNTASDPARVLAVTKAKDYLYLAVRVQNGDQKPLWECGWAKSSAVTEKQVPTADVPPCAQHLGKLANRYTFGYHFNCGPNQCDDGRLTSLTPDCNDELYRNDAAVDAATAGAAFSPPRAGESPLYDPIGKVSSSTPVYYRYTPLDNEAVVVRSNGNWVYMSRSCVVGYPQGGPPNTDG